MPALDFHHHEELPPMTLNSPCYTGLQLWYEMSPLPADRVDFAWQIRSFVADSGYCYPPHAKAACVRGIQTILDLCSAGF